MVLLWLRIVPKKETSIRSSTSELGGAMLFNEILRLDSNKDRDEFEKDCANRVWEEDGAPWPAPSTSL